MPYVPLPLPPGVFKNGTKYQAKNQWHDSDLMRWFEGAMGPVSGWRKLGEGFRSSTNLVTFSHDVKTGGVSSGVDDPTFATSVFGLGFRAMFINDDGGAAPNHWYKPVTGAPTDGSNETVSLILERSAMVEDTGIRVSEDPQQTGNRVTLNLEWDTLTLTVTEGAPIISATELHNMGEGPNGDQMVRIVVTYAYVTTLPSNSGRRIQVAPTGFAAAIAGSILWHHAQFEVTNLRGPIILTNATPVTAQVGRIELSEPIHGMFGWRDNTHLSRLALGTLDRAYAYADGVVTDITPASFTEGGNFAQLTTGRYGAGGYGAGVYGEGDTALTEIVEAQTWQFDNFGQFLVGMAHSDGDLYSWDLNDANDLTPIMNAPTNNSGVVVTPERFIVALGAGGDPRLVQWADQESLTVWTPVVGNQAGDFPLQGIGGLMMGARSRNETLLWTSDELYAMRYVGGLLVYTFTEVGRKCGPISRRAGIVADGGRAFWMGHKSFWMYNGYAVPVPSSVSDAVFNDINTQQSSKIFATGLAEYGEVWWYYPSAGSNELDRYVKFNYREGSWDTGNLSRNAGIDRGVFSHPLKCDRLGVVYEHERGTQKLSIVGAPLKAFVESGPTEISNGDQVMRIRQIVSDEQMLGQVNATLFVARYPTSSEVSVGPFTLANPTNVRATGRQVRLRLEEVSVPFRVGQFRLEVIPGGAR